jgi:hypothetical protein
LLLNHAPFCNHYTSAQIKLLVNRQGQGNSRGGRGYHAWAKSVKNKTSFSINAIYGGALNVFSVIVKILFSDNFLREKSGINTVGPRVLRTSLIFVFFTVFSFPVLD